MNLHIALQEKKNKIKIHKMDAIILPLQNIIIE